MIDFVDYQVSTRETAVYPEVGEGSLIALNYVALGLAGEGGEVAGKVKKIWRDDAGIITGAKAEAIEAELGDVLWYLARFADELGVSLQDIAQANLDKLNSRKARGVIGGSGDNR